MNAKKETYEIYEKGSVTANIHPSGKAKRLRITVLCNGRIDVVVPAGTTHAAMHAFMTKQAPWIQAQLDHLKLSPCASFLLEKPVYKKHKERARMLVQERLAFFNLFYGFAWNDVRIKNTRTIWGSCSKDGNLNFNYKIALLPPEVADYVVVHELCHLKEFNHSSTFWELVSRTVKSPHAMRAKLKSCDLLL